LRDEIGVRGHAIATVWCRKREGALTSEQHVIPDAEREANARLIASAPELLEVLEHVRDGMEASGGWTGDEDVFSLVVEAIAKATGDSHE
jgi:hypothetical protein